VFLFDVKEFFDKILFVPYLFSMTQRYASHATRMIAKCFVIVVLTAELG